MELGAFLRERGLYGSPRAVGAYRRLRRAAERVGLQVVLKTFYSPIPDLDRLPAGWFERPAELPGVDLRLDAQLAFLRERLAEPMARFDPAREPTGDPHRYAITNPSYQLLDAAILYAMITALRPARIVELGSGHSTLVTAQAVRASGHEVSYDVYDPFAAVARDDLPGVSGLHRVAAQDVPMSTFEALDSGDVLFVDTTHTVKTGGDVNFIVLDVLPRLRPGVVVHLHDIFLPFEYPRKWLEDFGLYWSEQYLLQALLAMNPGYEVVLAAAALAGLRRQELAAALPPGVPASGGSAFWIRRTAS
jgi:predicted O-methyltransferase YrrM